MNIKEMIELVEFGNKFEKYMKDNGIEYANITRQEIYKFIHIMEYRPDLQVQPPISYYIEKITEPYSQYLELKRLIQMLIE